MRIQSMAATFIAILGGTLSACGGGALDDLKRTEKFTLYSVVSGPLPPGTALPFAGEMFHGHPVLGRVEVVSPEAKKEIVDALDKGVRAAGGGMFPKCFDPRHGIRVTRLVGDVDYLICFECSQVRKFLFLGFYGTLSTSNSAQKTLNVHLRRAGVPLDPSMKGEI